MKRTSDYLNEIAHSSNLFYEMSPEELKKLKSLLLGMYTDVKRVCDMYDIKVMLSGGSCLGAVRHHGFIPWDEDIDLMMSRDDYNKFLTVIEKELSAKYEFSYPQSGRDSIGLMLKILLKRKSSLADSQNLSDDGRIILDVFPIERAPENGIVRRVKFLFLDLLRIFVLSTNLCDTQKSTMDELQVKALKCSVPGRLHYCVRYFIGKIVTCIGRQRVIDFYDRIASGSSGQSYYTINTGRGMSKKECLPKGIFFPPQKAEFEGVLSFIPNNVDAYLSNLYGDYMVMPPIEKRERHFFSKIDLSQY